MKILFLARSLNTGGAERQLVALAQGMHSKSHDVVVVLFYRTGCLADELHRVRIPVLSLDKIGRWDISFLFRLMHIIRHERPDVLYSFLDVPNVLSVMLKPFLSGCRVIWGVRAAFMDWTRYSWLSRFVYWLECRLSRYVDLIIVNSFAGRDYHLSNGFCPRKVVVVQNGIDADRFRCDRKRGSELRRIWGVDADQVLVGIVGRLDPMKDHPVFLHAAALLAQERSDVHFVCVGDGPENYKQKLQDLTTELGLNESVLWASEKNNMIMVYNALDVAVSSSSGEGFSNVIGEAMACCLPCVVTDVGDSAEIVGDCGYVVRPRDPNVLCSAILKMLSMQEAQRQQMGVRARERIVSKYSVQKMVDRSNLILETIA